MNRSKFKTYFILKPKQKPYLLIFKTYTRTFRTENQLTFKGLTSNISSKNNSLSTIYRSIKCSSDIFRQQNM